MNKKKLVELYKEESANVFGEIPTQKIGEFEQALLQKLQAKDSKILDSIRKDKTMSDETEKSLKDILEQLIKNFA